MTIETLPALCTVDEYLANDYDFVIIGGGTAGLAVAARLSENENVMVGVLEAGDARLGDPLIMIPACYPKLIGNDNYDWKHVTTPQKHANNKVKSWPRGKCLGGSSAINYQMYVRGHARDYDDFVSLGNEGWGFQDLLPYFKKHEHFEDPESHDIKAYNIPLGVDTKYDASYHGTNGPIHTAFSQWRVPVEKEWIAASAKLHSQLAVPNNAWSGDHLGTYHSLSTVNRSSSTGTRSYSASGYLLPNASRPNLKVLTEALVAKIVLKEAAGGVKPVGVEFIHKGGTHTVNVKSEVIVCAGSIKSPQILELSGIGNPDVLKQAGVQCLVENHGVGENLQDHPVTGMCYELVDGEMSLDEMQKEEVAGQYMQQYMSSHTGPLASVATGMAFASFANIVSKDELTTTLEMIKSGPDTRQNRLIGEGLKDPGDGSLQFVLLPASLNPDRFDDQSQLLQPPASQLGKNGITMGVCLARPLSRGSIHIKSSDPSIDPGIDPNYLAHPADVEVLCAGMQLMDKMVSTSPFKEKIKRRYFPAPEVDLNDRDQCRDFVRGYVGTEYHPIGSVALGEALDTRCRVKGVNGVRVVDASILPMHISGNPVATVYAIAEKCSDMIKEDHKL